MIWPVAWPAPAGAGQGCTRRTWTVHQPDGRQVGGEWSALWIAKYEAERAISAA